MARLSDVLKDLFDLALSEGALVSILEAARRPFAAQTNLIKQRMLSGTALASDETGMRVGKANWWLWVFHHGDSAAFVAEASRSKAVVEKFLGDWRPDVWLSDRLGSQIGWARREHQFCLAHLIRDVQYVIDQGEATFAPGLKGLLKRACALGRRRDGLADSTLKTYLADLNRRLDRLLSLRPAHAAGRKLQETSQGNQGQSLRLHDQSGDRGHQQWLRAHILVPARSIEKSPTASEANRATAFYADLRSVIETARRRCIRAIDAIRLTLKDLLTAHSSVTTESGT